ncbi:hypothetical protein [Streptomyces sp. NPDC026589]
MTARPQDAEPSGEGPGCLTTLASPSCFGFLAFICLLIAACAAHDLAI